VLEGAPAAGEQGESAFALAAQGTLDGVAGAGIDIQFLPAGGLFDGDVDAEASAVIAEVGEGRQVRCGGGVVQRRQGMGGGRR
jgi:hypothetical protein